MKNKSQSSTKDSAKAADSPFIDDINGDRCVDDFELEDHTDEDGDLCLK